MPHTQPIQRPRAAAPLLVANSHNESRILGSIRPPFDRSNAAMQLTQIHLFNKRHDRACFIVRRQHLVQHQHPHHHLIATRPCTRGTPPPNSWQSSPPSSRTTAVPLTPDAIPPPTPPLQTTDAPSSTALRSTINQPRQQSVAPSVCSERVKLMKLSQTLRDRNLRVTE